MKRPRSTQTGHEKTLAGPNCSTRHSLDPNVGCSILDQPKYDVRLCLGLKCSRWTQKICIRAENWLGFNVVNGFDRSKFSMVLMFYRKTNCAIMNMLKKQSKL